MKKLFWVYLFTFSINISYAQVFHWANDIQVGCSNENVHICTKVDGLGNVYTTGYFSGEVDFDRGPSVCKLKSQGNTDIYIVKYNAYGNLIWAKRIGGTGRDWGYSLALDATNNVYITGDFMSMVDFDPGYSSTSFTAHGYQAFILKLSGAGNFIWAKALDGTGFSSGNSIAVDDAGNVYTGGSFYQTIDFDPGLAEFNLRGMGTQDDIFLLKLDSKGKFLWVRSMGGEDDDHPSSLVLDHNNNVLMTGWFDGEANFGNYKLKGIQGGNIFISKISSNGDIWAKSIGIGRGYSIAVDAWNNAFITGYSATAIISTQLYISKFDAIGNLIWEKFIDAFIGYGRSICTDNQCNVYTTGSYYLTADFDPGPGTTYVTSNGYNDVFILKLDNSGEFKWVESIGGKSVDEGWSITSDDRVNIYTSGIFFDEVNFNLGSNGEVLKSDYGRADFIMKQGVDSFDIDGNKYPANFTLFPNPATDEIKIQYAGLTESISFTIMDAIGRKVMEGIINEKSNSINILQLSKGLYFMELGDHEFVPYKFVKQ